MLFYDDDDNDDDDDDDVYMKELPLKLWIYRMLQSFSTSLPTDSRLLKIMIVVKCASMVMMMMMLKTPPNSHSPLISHHAKIQQLKSPPGGLLGELRYCLRFIIISSMHADLTLNCACAKHRT